MRLIRDRDLGFLCTVPSRVRELIEHHEIFRLLKSTSVNLVVDYLTTRQMMMVDWRAPGCIGWFSYPWDTCVVLPQEEYCATVRDHGESAERFLPDDAVISLESFI